MAIDASVPLTPKSLGDHLWESENHTRNKISNPKDYVLALLFFKRACDRHAEETDAALEELADVPDATEIIAANPGAYHDLLIPDGCYWADVRNTDEDKLGQAVNDALLGISNANPEQLHSVFETIDFNNKRAVPPEALADLLDHFETLGPLTDGRCPADLLGRAYEWTIAKFAAGSGKRGGEFYTPAQVGKLGAQLLAPEPGQDVYDPTCGSGGLLLQVLAEAHRVHGARARQVSLFGQELTPETWAMARMNMLLHGAGGAATIVQGDTLAAPAFLDGAELRRFDLVIANPPFSSKNWGHERFKAAGDPFGRISHLPSKSHGEMAFVQHMVASLTRSGRMAVVLPNGCFFRGGAEMLVRRDLIEEDIVESVIQLPKDMFYGAAIPACWLIVNRAKPTERVGRVLFVDASELFERFETKNVLRDSDIDRIVSVFHGREVLDGFATFATCGEIGDHRYVLSPRRYVGGSATDDEVMALEDAAAAYREARDRRLRAEEGLLAVLASLDEQSD